VPGIATAASHVGIEWYSGIHWRLGAIDSGQKRSVTDESESGERPAPRVRVFDPADRELFLVLQRDGRARYRDLARELGTSEYLVRRQLDTLVRRGMLAFRTDFARSEGGWPAQFVLRLSVPHDRLAEFGAEIGAWPTTRICLSAVGPANLLVVAQAHRIGDLTAVLDRIQVGSHDVVVADQRLVLRVVKSWGRLVDTDGRAAGVVPVDPWATLTPGG
jgi:DNA-binding Lrp family transcriptional regulator